MNTKWKKCWGQKHAIPFREMWSTQFQQECKMSRSHASPIPLKTQSPITTQFFWIIKVMHTILEGIAEAGYVIWHCNWPIIWFFATNYSSRVMLRCPSQCELEISMVYLFVRNQILSWGILSQETSKNSTIQHTLIFRKHLVISHPLGSQTVPILIMSCYAVLRFY